MDSYLFVMRPIFVITEEIKTDNLENRRHNAGENGDICFHYSSSIDLLNITSTKQIKGNIFLNGIIHP
jgi:hypothetical protein